MYWMIISGALGALSNLCMRKSMETQGSVFAFFFYQLLLTFIVVTFLHPISTSAYSLNWFTVLSSLLAGIALGSLKYMIGCAIKKGPTNLTFASVNSASVAPACIIALLFGTSLNYSYTLFHAAGSVLVVAGLFWAIYNQTFASQKTLWVLFAIGAFIVQTLFLLALEMHALVVNNCHLWDISREELYSEWYLPFIFLTACLMHVAIYFYKEKRTPTSPETLWGILGGLLNGSCAFFFMHAINTASELERAFIFPTFSISLIIACNLWAQVLYKEKIHWPASSLCLLGVLVGS